MGRIRNWFRQQLIKALSPVDSSRGWVTILQEGFAGALVGRFQTDNPVSLENGLTHPTVYACVTQISSDIGKLNLRLMEKKQKVWSEVDDKTFSPLFRRPNTFQIRQKFIEFWIMSKLNHGNTYVLKVRDPSGKVIGLYILDPTRVVPLIADDGSVFYRLRQDPIGRVFEDGIVPAREIIHDTMECLFHPLVGVPPLYAASLATTQGLNMQKNSAKFFGNNSQPGGVLTAPGHIKEETAARIKEYWANNYTGDNAGKVAVLGDGLKYEQMSVTAKDANMVEQFKWSDEKICSTFKVPPYKVHVGPMPTYQQSETLERAYFSGCLQRFIEAIEALLDEGLEIPNNFRSEFDVEDLLRMDLSLKMDTAVKGVGGGILSPNEAREKFNLSPVKGGATPYLQQQNYSLAALDERDKDKPFSKPDIGAPAVPAKPTEEDEDQDEDETDKALYLLYQKSFMEEEENEIV